MIYRGLPASHPPPSFANRRKEADPLPPWLLGPALEAGKDSHESGLRARRARDGRLPERHERDQCRRRTYAASPVSYRRGESSISVRAQVGRSNFSRDDGDGFHVDTEARDYLVTAADLVIDDVPVEPANGDKIVVTGPDRCTEHVYE